MPIFIKRVDVVQLEEEHKKTKVGQWLDWLRRPKKTSPTILSEVVAEPLYGQYDSFGAFHKKVEDVSEDLATLGLHDMNAFEVDLDTFDANAPAPAPGQPLECVVKVTLKEKHRLGLSAKLSAEGENAVGETDLTMSNYFGQAEKISGSVAGAQGQTIANLTFERPLLKRPYGSRLVRCGIGNSHMDNRGYSSHVQDDVSAWLSYVQDSHNLTYEATYRDVKIARSATEGMLAEGGPSIKSALRYSFTLDSRNDHLMPRLGRRLKVGTEVSGLLGDAKHLKLDVAYNKNVTLANNLIFQFVASSGALFNFGTRSHIADRFFFGGVVHPFHGFRVQGAGPRLGRDSYGGDFFWTVSTHANMPITSTPLGELYGHAFSQAGNCVSRQDIASLFGGKDPNSPIRMTAGAGIALRTPLGIRFDLTYAVPLSHGPNDIPQRWSFGGSFNFG